LKIFSLVPSSSASERCFSTFGFCHSKLRNKLSPETVHKLVYIKTNENQAKFGDSNDFEDDFQDELDSQSFRSGIIYKDLNKY